jgi:predicted small lipoprotein YifL
MLTAACGQKGPLFLPGNPSEIQSDVPRQAQSDEEEEDTEDEAGNQQ